MGQCCFPCAQDTYEERNQLMPSSQFMTHRRYQSIENLVVYDDSARELLNENHLVWKHFWKTNFKVPVASLLEKPGTRVLDVGCGSGTWLLDLASQYPNAKFTGIDTNSQMFPRKGLYNVEFFKADILQGTEFEDGTFDFVFQRLMADAFTVQQWDEQVIKELVRITKINGWIELCEVDVALYGNGPVTRLISEAVIKLYRNEGMIGFPAKHLPYFLKNSGLRNVESMENDIMLSSLPTEYENMALKHIVARLETLKPLLGNILEVTEKQYRNLIEDFKSEIDTYPVLWKTRRFWGRKTVSKEFHLF